MSVKISRTVRRVGQVVQETTKSSEEEKEKARAWLYPRYIGLSYTIFRLVFLEKRNAHQVLGQLRVSHPELTMSHISAAIEHERPMYERWNLGNHLDAPESNKPMRREIANLNMLYQERRR